MIGISNTEIAAIPSLIITDQTKENAELPSVVYFHGFTSAKEHNLPFAYLLAEKGYRVILPDSIHHGQRKSDMSSEQMQLSFWDIMLQNVRELKNIKEALDDKGLLLDRRFGVAGTSMGGITTAAALTQYPWIQTAGVLMGSPKITAYAKTLVDSLRKEGNLSVADDTIEQLYNQLEYYDLSNQIEKLQERPILFWHGDSDPIVPFDHSYSFYNIARPHYTDQEKIRFIKEQNRGHKVSRHAILETVKWFEQHL